MSGPDWGRLWGDRSEPEKAEHELEACRLRLMGLQDGARALHRRLGARAGREGG